jgi:hypothetical protein
MTPTARFNHPSVSRGNRVEVRSHLDGEWYPGFQIAQEIVSTVGVVGYRVRRGPDGTTLPVVFAVRDVRGARRPVLTIVR